VAYIEVVVVVDDDDDSNLILSSSLYMRKVNMASPSSIPLLQFQGGLEISIVRNPGPSEVSTRSRNPPSQRQIDYLT
jgi:hypothetical protein